MKKVKFSTSWLVQGWYWYNFCPTRIVVSAQIETEHMVNCLRFLARIAAMESPLPEL